MRLILGVSLSRRAIGTAVLSYGTLIKWNIRSFHNIHGKNKSKAVIHSITQLVTKYEIEAIAIKIPDRIERYKELTNLVGAINVIAERKHLKPKFYSLNEIKHFYSGDTKINKQALVNIILEKYSVLMPSYRKEKGSNKGYYIKIFEAVAAAHVIKSNMDY